MERKLYVDVRRDGFSIKDPHGRTVETVKLENKDTLATVEKSLEASLKFSRGVIYVFTYDSRIVNWMSGRWRIRNREIAEKVIRIKSLESLFRTVRYFHVRRC